ncbi:hypothetical protein ACWEQL_25545 [Kitasatospora sp. NPDC004240]
MSHAGGESAVEGPVELGRCRFCGAWVRGRFIADLTPHIALVEHCPPPDEEDDEGDPGER